MLYTINNCYQVEVINVGITEEERRHFEEVDEIWEQIMAEEENEENETQND